MFPDKFTTDQDKKWFADSVMKIGKEAFGDTFGNVLREALDRLWYSFMSDIDYSEFENVDENDIPRIYEQFSSFDALRKRCNDKGKETRSNVGVGGSGKQ